MQEKQSKFNAIRFQKVWRMIGDAYKIGDKIPVKVIKEYNELIEKSKQESDNNNLHPAQNIAQNAIFDTLWKDMSSFKIFKAKTRKAKKKGTIYDVVLCIDGYETPWTWDFIEDEFVENELVGDWTPAAILREAIKIFDSIDPLDFIHLDIDDSDGEDIEVKLNKYDSNGRKETVKNKIFRCNWD